MACAFFSILKKKGHLSRAVFVQCSARARARACVYVCV